MVIVTKIVTTKTEVLIKNKATSTDMSTYKLEFDDSSVEIKGNYLLIYIKEKDSLNIITRLFNLSDVYSYKEYREYREDIKL